MTPQRALLYLQVLLGVVLLGAVACGCRFTGAQRKIDSGVHDQKNVTANQNQIRLRMRGLVDPMCGELEAAADQIIAGTTNRAVQRAALLWKIDGVPALREALFQPLPLMAIMDTWVLCNQMADYFETGPGKAAFGEASTEALKTCRRMEEEIYRVTASASSSGDVSKARAFARKWAAEHPIRHSIADRESTLSRAFDWDAADVLSAGEAVVEFTTTMDDLNRRIEVYSDQLFRQARWEAELFKTDLMAELPVAQALPLAERAVKSAESATTTVDRLAPVIERAVGLAETAPGLIATEREATLKALHDELTRALESVQQERIAAFELISSERVAVLKELFETVTAERRTLTHDLEQISFKVVDHAFWRAAQLLAAVLLVLVIGLIGAAILFRRLLVKDS